MYIPSRLIERFAFEAVDVLDENGVFAFRAARDRALDLAAAGQVSGVATGNKLKRLQLMVPISSMVSGRPSERAVGGLSGEDSTTSWQEMPQTYSLLPTCAAYAPGEREARELMAVLG